MSEINKLNIFTSSRRKAISYIRMSTEVQLRGHSLQRQKKLAEDYCQKHNLELIEELQDIGLSGYSGKHRAKGQLGAFFDGIRQTTIDPKTILLVENLDRLSRQDPLTAMTQFSEILSYGIEIHTLFDGQVYTKELVGSNMGLLFLSIGQMIRAYDESRTKSQRLSAAWEKKRQTPGTYLTSRTPNWINVIKDQSGAIQSYDLDNLEAKVIRKIFDLTINNNMGSFAITRYLNANLDKYPKKSFDRRNAVSGWGTSYIKKILQSPTVFGELQPMKSVGGKRVPAAEPIKNYYPAAITKAEFLLAQERQKQRTINGRGRKGVGFPNLFTGLIKCRKCHATFRYRDRGLGPKGTITLHCSSAIQHKAGCEARMMRYVDFEERFFSVVSDINFASVFDGDDAKREELELELSISIDNASLTESRKQLNLLMDELLDPSLKDSLKVRIRDRMNEMDTVLETLEKKRTESLSKLEELRDRASTDIHGELVRDVRDLVASQSSPEEAETLRRGINHALKRLIDVIYVDNAPDFHRDDVELLDEEDLAPEFLKWFSDNRRVRWKYQTALEYVESEYGFAKHQEFKAIIYIHFKNGQIRAIFHDKTFIIIDPEG